MNYPDEKILDRALEAADMIDEIAKQILDPPSLRRSYQEQAKAVRYAVSQCREWRAKWEQLAEGIR